MRKPALRVLRRTPRRHHVSLMRLDEDYNYWRRTDDFGYDSRHLDRSGAGQERCLGNDWAAANQPESFYATYVGRHAGPVLVRFPKAVA